jgi:hypothetical protein
MEPSNSNQFDLSDSKLESEVSSDEGGFDQSKFDETVQELLSRTEEPMDEIEARKHFLKPGGDPANGWRDMDVNIIFTELDKVVQRSKDDDMQRLKEHNNFTYFIAMCDEFPAYSASFPVIFKKAIDGLGSEGIEMMATFFVNIIKMQQASNPKTIEWDLMIKFHEERAPELLAQFTPAQLAQMRKDFLVGKKTGPFQ